MVTIDEIKDGLTKLIDFWESRPTRSRFSRFSLMILTEAGFKTMVRLEKNEKACQAAMSLLLRVLRQICKDNNLEFLELDQWPTEPHMILSEETEKRLQEFQEFIKAN